MLLDNWLAFTAAPVSPPGQWAPQTPRRVQHRRSVLTWRLTIDGAGTIGHHQPEPLVITATLTSGGAARGHSTTTVLYATTSDGRLAGNTVISHRTESVVTATIVDPDEWLILDDPALS
jgi:hypothetical protein